MTGNSSSVTVTLNEQLTELPEASIEMEVTVVVPTGKIDPDAEVEFTMAVQLSVVLTLKSTLAPFTPGSVVLLISAGHIITGD